MSTRMNSIRSRIRALLLFGFTSFCRISFQAGPVDMHEEARRFYDSHNGDIHVEAKIVDEHGAPIHNVVVTENARTFNSLEGGKREGKTTVDGAYVGDFKYVSVVDLRFTNPAYHYEKRVYAFNSPGVSAKVEGKTQRYDNETIVLGRIGIVAHLDTHRIRLESDPVRGTTLVDLHKLVGTGEAGKVVTTTAQIEALASVTSESQMFVRVASVSGREITPLTERGFGKELSPRNSQIEVVLNDGHEGGFRLCHPKQPDRARPLLELKEAPKDGYSSVLTITKEFLESQRHADVFVPISFYCRINGLYGKGIVDGASYINGKIWVGLVLHLQHDGSRNVTTGD